MQEDNVVFTSYWANKWHAVDGEIKDFHLKIDLDTELLPLKGVSRDTLWADKPTSEQTCVSNHAHHTIRSSAQL